MLSKLNNEESNKRTQKKFKYINRGGTDSIWPTFVREARSRTRDARMEVWPHVSSLLSKKKERQWDVWEAHGIPVAPHIPIAKRLAVGSKAWDFSLSEV
jgi:hypothetical protein